MEKRKTHEKKDKLVGSESLFSGVSREDAEETN
jgi:hypothetical protein